MNTFKKRSDTLGMLAGLLLLTLPACITVAQSGNQGTLTITVQDKTGGIVPGAELFLQDLATNDVRHGTILASGTYSFPALNAGTYKLSITKAGYKDAVYDAVTIQASRVTDVSAVLDIGAVTDKVTIQVDQTPLVDSTSNVISTTIDLKEIENLPMDDRDPTALLYFIPGVAAGYFNNQVGQAQVNTMDGVVGNSSRMKAGGNIEAATVPRIQNVEEMTIQTSGLEANQGYGQGAMQAVLATRRGTNQYHGRLFANLQNSSFNANSWYNDFTEAQSRLNNTGPVLNTKPLYHKNDFGGSVGGRIVKDKLFFFGAYEQDSIPGRGTPYNSFMTRALQAGNYMYLSACGASPDTFSAELSGIHMSHS